MGTALRPFAAIVLCALVLGSVDAAPRAQSAPSGHAALEWTGYYTFATGADLQGFKPINPNNWHKLIVDHLQPWARAKMEATDGIAEDPGSVCQPTGPFRYPTQAGNFMFLPASDKILLVWQNVNTGGVQRVYMNRKHPRNLLASWTGDSIGWWEDDTLVVDTIGLNDKSWLSPAMEPHTGEAHFIQRIRRVGNGKLLEILNTVEDRLALTSAYQYARYYKFTGETLPEDVCNEDADTWWEIRMKRLTPLLEGARVVR